MESTKLPWNDDRLEEKDLSLQKDDSGTSRDFYTEQELKDLLDDTFPSNQTYEDRYERMVFWLFCLLVEGNKEIINLVTSNTRTLVKLNDEVGLINISMAYFGKK